MNITFIKWLSQPEQMNYVNASGITRAEREKRKQELKFKFDQLNFADFRSGEVEDCGREESIYSQDELAEIREEIAFAEVRKTTLKAEIEPELRRYIQRRNDASLRSKKLAAQRFGFTIHSTKGNH